MSAGGQIRIGTSGWSYAHWKGPFYPEDIPNSRMLDFYVGQLKSVEINSSFYHLPLRKTLNSWHEKFKQWAQQSRDIYCYFDNDENGFAALNAMELQGLVDGVLLSSEIAADS